VYRVPSLDLNFIKVGEAQNETKLQHFHYCRIVGLWGHDICTDTRVPSASGGGNSSACASTGIGPAEI